MQQLTLVILLVISTTVSTFLYLRGLKLRDRAVKSEQDKVSQDADLKKIRSKVRKLEKQAKNDGSRSSKGESKVAKLQNSVENLRQELAAARRTERKAVHDLDQLSAEFRALRSQQEDTPERAPEEPALVEEVVEETAPDPDDTLRHELKDALDASEKTKRSLKKSDGQVEALTAKLDALRRERNASKRELIIARRKAEHQRRAYVLTQGQLEVAQDLLGVLEQRTGTPSDESFLLESLRAQKRLSIKKGRVEERSKAEMPVVAVVEGEGTNGEPEHVGGEP